MASTFDQARGDDALRDLGQAVLADPNYGDNDWRGIALVVEVAPRKRSYGYIYRANDWEAQTPQDFEVIYKAVALSEAMVVQGERWRRCLLQITREPGGAPELKVAFDYDGTADWTVTPANVDEMVEKLRP